MNTFFNSLPPVIYAIILLVAMVALSTILIFTRKSYPIPYIISFIMIIISGVLLIILRLNWLGSIKEILTPLTFLFLIAGLSTLFISGYLHNRKSGIKMDKTLKRIILGCLFVVLLSALFVAFCLYMKNR